MNHTLSYKPPALLYLLLLGQGLFFMKGKISAGCYQSGKNQLNYSHADGFVS